MIEISIESETVMTGHFVAGEVRWSDDVTPNRIVVAAEWKVSVFDGSRRGVGRSMAHVPVRGERAGTFPIHLLIPHEGPVTFAGQILTIEWNVWVRVDRPGKDEFANVAFRVIPRASSAERIATPSDLF